MNAPFQGMAETRGEGDSADGVAGVRRTKLFDVLTAAVALIGLADAIYLTAEHLAGRNIICMVTTGCDAVLMSPYAKLPGDIPLAALGAVAYFTVFSLATLSIFGYKHTALPLRLTVAAMFAFTLWLLYLQAFVIEAYCSYCLLSAAVTTTLTAIQIAHWLLGAKKT